MITIVTAKLKDKVKEINRRLLLNYWSILYPLEKYVKPLVDDNKTDKPDHDGKKPVDKA